MSTKGVRIVPSQVAGAKFTLRDADGSNPEVYELVVPTPPEYTQSSPELPANADPVWLGCPYAQPGLGGFCYIDGELFECIEEAALPPAGNGDLARFSRGAAGTAIVAHTADHPMLFASPVSAGALPVLAIDEGALGAPLAAAIAARTTKPATVTGDGMGGYMLWVWSASALQVEATEGIAISGSVLVAANPQVTIPVTGDGYPEAVTLDYDAASVVSAVVVETGATVPLEQLVLTGRVLMFVPNDVGAMSVRVTLAVA
jgi:hypothetical protein